MKNNFKIKSREIVFSVVIFIFFLLLMEGGMRIFNFIKYKNKYNREMNFSTYLGWETTQNDSWKRDVKGYGEVVYTTQRSGFRIFGDIDSNKIKIFVIGDSFTQAHTVSDGKIYYDYLRNNNNNVEIFAYGGGGYGSLQEYMILDKYFDIIKPHIILWQFCQNDIINNDYDLESVSFKNNNHMTRPYYREGKIEWLYPEQSIGWFSYVVKSSHLLRFLHIRINIFKAEQYGSIEDELSVNHPLFIKAAKITSDIMGLVKKRVGDTPIVAFSVNKPRWEGNTFREICEKHGIHFIPNIPEAIEEAKQFGMIVDGLPFDGHWNDNGHSIAGKVILDYLTKNNLLKPIFE